MQHVLAGRVGQAIVAGAAVQRVVAIAAVENILAVATVQGVVAVAAVERVRAQAAVDGVVAAAAVQRVAGARTRFVAAVDQVVAGAAIDEVTEKVILTSLEELIERLDHMREEEGRGAERELRERMEGLSHAVNEIGKLRALVSRAYLEKVQLRMNELIAGHIDPDRVLQEAAMLAERSDIQEEVVRLENHFGPQRISSKRMLGSTNSILVVIGSPYTPRIL